MVVLAVVPLMLVRLLARREQHNPARACATTWPARAVGHATRTEAAVSVPAFVAALHPDVAETVG